MQIRASSNPKNVRKRVAPATAIMKTSELMKGDENIKFVQLPETITKIADKGKHTFVVGDLGRAAIIEKNS